MRGDRGLIAWGYPVRRRVLVNLKSGNAIEGILVRSTLTLLFLANAEATGKGFEHGVQVDGRVIIERRNIEFTVQLQA